MKNISSFFFIHFFYSDLRPNEFLYFNALSFCTNNFCSFYMNIYSLCFLSFRIPITILLPCIFRCFGKYKVFRNKEPNVGKIFNMSTFYSQKSYIIVVNK